MESTRLLGSGARLAPADNVQSRKDGTVLTGGWPLRRMRLSPAGADLVGRWFAGDPVGDTHAERGLAWRLVDAGLATLLEAHRTDDDGIRHPVPVADFEVVVPVKDDLEGLLATLSAIGAGEAKTVFVVDDGSRTPLWPPPARLSRVIEEARTPVVVLRRPQAGGPGEARNQGLANVSSPVVVFVDAAVTVDSTDLTRLAIEVTEPNTVAVGPRVRAGSRSVAKVTGSPMRRAIADYERRRSPLDMGHKAMLVRQGSPVSYLPSTCLAVRTHVVRSIGGFDPALRYGEDVDLVWRLAGHGWVRYVPRIEALHPPRSSLAAFAAQRFAYGTSAGPLARRHRRSVAPVRLTPAPTLAWAALLSSRPSLFGLVSGWMLFRLRSLLGHQEQSTSEAARLTVRSLRWTGAGLLEAAARVWWPLLIPALGFRRLRRRAALVLAMGRFRMLRGRKADLDPVDIALGLIDDCSYGAGVWAGAVRARTADPIVPWLDRGSRATSE